MTSEEKKEIACITIKCILGFVYLCLGFHYLFEVLFPKNEVEDIEEAIDNHVIVRLRPVNIMHKHEEECKHDA